VVLRIDSSGVLRQYVGMAAEVPSDPLRAVFTEDVIARLQSRQNPSEQLKHRLKVLCTDGQQPDLFAQRRRALKAAWDTYVHAGFALGLLDGEHGLELISRLTGVDDDSFRSGMSECLAAWYLAGPLRLTVEPRPEGRPGRPLEFVIRHPEGDINVEVKAAYREMPTEGAFWFDDSDMLIAGLKDANKQFARGTKNLLVLVPQLTIPVTLDFRAPLEKAFIGETMITVQIDMGAGGPVGPVTYPYKERGYLTRSGKEPPRYTRVSGVLYLGEMFAEDYRSIEHLALLVYNPNAPLALPCDIWKETPFFSRQGDQWAWSDTGERGL
jgi:hypothetical protein